MKLALDFDGTIADTNRMKSKLIKKRYGISIPSWQCDRTLCVSHLGEDAYEEISNIVYERPSTLKTPPLPNSLTTIKKLSKIAELYMLTARPVKRLAYAREWLINHHIDGCFKGSISSFAEGKLWRPKLEICQENKFDLLMDDDQRHFEKDGFDDIIKVLIKNDCRIELEVPANTQLVCSWREFYLFCVNDILKESR